MIDRFAGPKGAHSCSLSPFPFFLCKHASAPALRWSQAPTAAFASGLLQVLSGLRWQVREAEGGAEAWAEAEAAHPEALIVDSWLPDLDLNEFLADFRGGFPGIDVVTTGASSADESPRGPYRQELLYALRSSQENDGVAWNAARRNGTAPTVLEMPKVELPHDSCCSRDASDSNAMNLRGAR